MRALYINLASSTDRRDWFDAQAVRLGLNIERFDAIASDAIEESVALRFGVSKSTVACFYSHRAVWNEIASGPDEYVAIFEDDAHLSADLSAFLVDSSWIPADADIVHIEKLGKRFWGHRRWAESFWAESLPSNLKFLRDRRLYHFARLRRKPICNLHGNKTGFRPKPVQ
ncbi:MAG: glycosyltransferase family 25 protein [Mesorhizobium sp.]|nr:MAG: glycosyltransferase family 25 protein [Mesorhizobium sp.]